VILIGLYGCSYEFLGGQQAGWRIAAAAAARAGQALLLRWPSYYGCTVVLYSSTVLSFNPNSNPIQRIGIQNSAVARDLRPDCSATAAGISRVSTQTGSGRKSGKVWARLCYLAS
jgi:hypothetical protein